jgi:hypothetical protein
MSVPDNIGVETRRRAVEGLTDGLLAAAEELRRRTIPDIPPTDPGRDPDPSVNLRENVNITPQPDGTVIVSVDGPHAAKQHEDQRLEHPRGGGPKFLEKNVKSLMRELPRIVAGDVRANMSGDPISHRRASGRRKR